MNEARSCNSANSPPKLSKLLNLSLLFSGLAASSACFAQTCFPPPSGLVSWWAADGDATDIDGTNPGILKNGTSFGSGVHLVSMAIVITSALQPPRA